MTIASHFAPFTCHCGSPVCNVADAATTTVKSKLRLHQPPRCRECQANKFRAAADAKRNRCDYPVRDLDHVVSTTPWFGNALAAALER